MGLGLGSELGLGLEFRSGLGWGLGVGGRVRVRVRLPGRAPLSGPRSLSCRKSGRSSSTARAACRSKQSSCASRVENMRS